MSVLLSVEDLRVNFVSQKPPVQAVRGVSFQLEAGECLGIVGESGSGKSVTAWASAGLLGSDALREGRIILHGQDWAELSPDQRRSLRGTQVAMIFQEPSRSFDPIMTLEKTFWETLRAHRPETTRDEARVRATALLNEVHIADAESRLGSFPHQFSGGMLQRVMIALALANNPQVLLCDEPTTALDVTIQAQILALLNELRRRRGLSMVFISHDLETVAQVADRILVFYGGLVLEEAPTDSLLSHPRQPYTKGLWDSRVKRGSHYSTAPLTLIGGSPPDPQYPEPGCPFAPRCPRSQDRCRAELPPLEGAPGRRHRCWFPLEEP
jgi:oligopeptide/dipeptide ABC transporter ATP-binding protein